MRMRKKRHGSERLRTLSELLYPVSETEGENGVELKLEPPETVFGNSNPVLLEVGCGKGEYITVFSERNPGINCIAVERISDVALKAMEKYAGRRGIGEIAPNGGFMTRDGVIHPFGETISIPREERGNVRFVIGEANSVLPAMADGSVSVIVANFSDPWSRKSTYSKRRLTHPLFLKNYKRVLTEDGKFLFKTDNDILFDYTYEMLSENGFRIVFETRDLHASERAGENIVTEYEKNFSDAGIPIKMLEAVPVRDHD